MVSLDAHWCCGDRGMVIGMMGTKSGGNNRSPSWLGLIIRVTGISAITQWVLVRMGWEWCQKMRQDEGNRMVWLD
jgi:hypothetical protein